jgi:hypothetical protein
MDTRQQTQDDRIPLENGAQTMEAAPSASTNMAVVRALGQSVLRSETVQVGVGVLAAAGAGLVLVSVAGVGATAVAGAAGYLAYRELTTKKKV